MATVDLVCTFDGVGSSAWTDGTNITVADGNTAYINVGQYALAKLAFTTNAVEAIPAGATKTSVKLVVRARVGFATGKAYLKEPGGFSDGGSAGHTVSLTTTLTTYVSSELSIERPEILTDSLASGYVRLLHEYSYAANILVDYIALRVTYTEGGGSIPLLFMSENM